MGRGPVRPINFREDGPRPCPAHQFFRGRVAARPGPSKFQRMGRGPAQTITISIFHGPARPGPSIFQKSRPGPARPITFSKVSARPGPARHNFQIGPAWPGPDKRPMTSRALNKYFKTDEKKWHYCDGCPAQFCELRPDFFTSYVNPM